MEDVLQKFIDVLFAQVSGQFLILKIIGLFVILCGLIPIGLGLLILIKGKRVPLQVVALHEEARKIDENDDPQRAAKKRANPKLRPEFVILEGEYKGLREKSGSASTTPSHAIGDLTQGYYMPQTGGGIESVKQVRTTFKIGFWICVAGFGFMLFVSFLGGSVAAEI